MYSVEILRTADEVRNLARRYNEIEREKAIAGRSQDLDRFAQLIREQQNIKATVTQKRCQIVSQYR